MLKQAKPARRSRRSPRGEFRVTQQSNTQLQKHLRSVSEVSAVLNEPTKCIQVANLKMPYTIIELRELMETFGKFNRCWTNRTQTHCMVEVVETQPVQIGRFSPAGSESTIPPGLA